MARRVGASGDGLVRIGVAIEDGLLRRFDSWLDARGGGNRSEALRDLIRDQLISADVEEHSDVVASVSIVYDHHHRELNQRLTDLQHHHGDMVVSALHVHIEHDRCLEVVVLRGRAFEVRAFAERLIGEKGVVHGGTFLTRRLDAGGPRRGKAAVAHGRPHPAGGGVPKRPRSTKARRALA
jgi:CopG family nickel-responsive transcriptional regulator